MIWQIFLLIRVLCRDLTVRLSRTHNVASQPFLAAKFAMAVPKLPPPKRQNSSDEYPMRSALLPALIQPVELIFSF